MLTEVDLMNEMIDELEDDSDFRRRSMMRSIIHCGMSPEKAARVYQLPVPTPEEIEANRPLHQNR